MELKAPSRTKTLGQLKYFTTRQMAELLVVLVWVNNNTCQGCRAFHKVKASKIFKDSSNNLNKSSSNRHNNCFYLNCLGNKVCLPSNLKDRILLCMGQDFWEPNRFLIGNPKPLLRTTLIRE